MCSCFADNTYFMIGGGIAKVLIFLYIGITLIKPLSIKFYELIGLPFDYESHHAPTAMQELGKGVFFSDESAAMKAGLWLLYLLLSTVISLVGFLVILLVWPLGIAFLIAFMVFKIGNKNKKD